jgi:type I restriction enzyme S subunit
MSKSKPYFRGVLIMDNEKDFKDLPEGWKWVRLGEVIEDIADGGTPSRDNPEYFNGNINWLVVDDIQRKIIKTKETITVKGLKHSSAKLWKKGTVILSFGATIGEVGIAEIELATKQGIAGIIPQKNKLLNTFLYYVLKHNKHILLRYANQTTIMEVRPSVIKEKFKFPLPPLPEQQKIAEILETIDNAIEKTDKIIKKYKRIKQGLMQDLLTKGIDENGNIRDEKTHKFKDSPLGRIPEEWEVVRLENISNKIIDGTHFTPQYSEDGIPFLRVIDLQASTVNLDNVMRISPQEHRILSKRCFPEYGDILLSKNGTIGISKVVDWKWEFSIFVSICLIKPKHEKVINIYLKYFFDSEWIKKQIVKRTKQLSVVNLHLEEIREFFILLPPLPEQQRIAEILSQIDQTIEKEQQYKEKLQRIKQGLMQDLLTGKVRVNHLVEEKEDEQRYTSNFTRT